MTAPAEMTRPVKVRSLPAADMRIEASEDERAALARRFAVTAIERLIAEVTFAEGDEGIAATGRLDAEIVQPCAVTREDFSYRIAEDINLLFVPDGRLTRFDEDEEIELAGNAPDEVEYQGDTFDIGEALAQTLGLAIDPYREGPDAEAARAAAGIESDEDARPGGPLAEALRALKGDGA